MAAFALAASISPGPVNLLGLNSGLRHGVATGLWYVTGATLGFIALFVCIGLGLYGFLSLLPGFEQLLRWAGVAFLLYLSAVLLRDDGRLGAAEQGDKPGFMTGALLQWLNPKAWLASASGIGAFAGGGDLRLTLVFAAIYLPVCWLSLSSWVVAGRSLRTLVSQPARVRAFNRVLALALLASCALLVV